MITYKHLIKHNITLKAYKNLGYPTLSLAYSEKQSESLKKYFSSLSLEEKQKKAESSHTLVASIKRSIASKRVMNTPEMIEAKRNLALDKNHQAKLQIGKNKFFSLLSPAGLEEYHHNRGRSISKAKTGVPRPDMLGEKNINNRPEVKLKQQMANARRGREVFIKGHNTFLKKNLNYSEELVFNILEQSYPSKYKTNTKGEIIVVGRRKPDFVNLEDKKFVEFFGRKWHKPEDELHRINHYKKFGYECLVIWSEELNDLVSLRNKINVFQYFDSGKLKDIQNMSNANQQPSLV